MSHPHPPHLDYATPQLSTAPAPEPPRRFASVDALRGFSMFWIIGGDYLVRSLEKIYPHPFTHELALQMEHCDWAGFHFYDLIFPMFVWIVGVAIPFSIPRLIEQKGTRAALGRIAIRSLVLFLLGVIYMGGISKGLDNIYLAGVLQRIAVAYFFAAILFCFFEARALTIIAALLLVGYWALLTFVPVPGESYAYASYAYAEGHNLAHYIDQRFLPGRKFEGTILSTLPAVANCILGIFAGLLIRDWKQDDQTKGILLMLAGTMSVIAGKTWSLQFPIIKLLWTSTYVLIACGISVILLGIFHIVIEAWHRRTWAKPLVWIGTNAIAVYLVSAFANFRGLAERLVGGEIAASLGRYADFTRAAVTLAIALGFVRFLYRRGIFLRL